MADTDLSPHAPDGAPRVRVFKSINKTQRSRLVREQLEEAIDRGMFKPGARLPSERELVEEFGVSRVSVREALRSLEALGVIEVQPGRGCFVSGDLLANRQRTVREWLAAHGREVVHLLIVRAAIETVGAEEAARRHDPTLLAHLETSHAEFVAAVEAHSGLARLVELDVRFHEALADASGIALVAELTRQLNSHLSEARRLTMMPPGRPKRSAREHGTIVAAVVAGDPKAAARAMQRHVKKVEEAVVRFTAASSP
jgi:GntR family transcriptional repressor for pyruvate dehydrogenase complex